MRGWHQAVELGLDQESSLPRSLELQAGLSPPPPGMQSTETSY